MKLEVGKYYRTRDGRKVKIESMNEDEKYPFNSDDDYSYTERGNYWCIDEPSGKDLIAEWTETPEVGPVRTVTRQEIVPGVYGCVKVHDPGSKYVRINVDAAMDVDELTDAITTLTAIRDAMCVKDIA